MLKINWLIDRRLEKLLWLNMSRNINGCWGYYFAVESLFWLNLLFANGKHSLNRSDTVRFCGPLFSFLLYEAELSYSDYWRSLRLLSVDNIVSFWAWISFSNLYILNLNNTILIYIQWLHLSAINMEKCFEYCARAQ